jgi:Xaa-Pro aminopeptidase
MIESYRVPLPTDNILPVVDYTRMVKRQSAFIAIRKGVRILARVFAWVSQTKLVGKTEEEVAVAIAKLMKQHGAQALAFPIIVASGPQSAEIHHWPTKRKIKKEEVLMIDCGAVVDGWCTDCTRTFFIGKPSVEFKTYYQAVLKAQELALSKITAGVKARLVDSAARTYLNRYAWGKTFRHTTGHGIGSQVHELPSLGTKSNDILLARSVVTVEPGVYIKGWGGVRIEDMVVVEKEGACVLTQDIPKRLTDVILNLT